uniref:Spliceosome-associated protein CWC27 homolog n=1 Tax=Triatoma infestans TaxID=30076 RepID=A0A023F0U4_TRIIF
MSSIYIQEPPTSGKVLLKTSVGDIDIELWSKETPLACRNFIQLSLEGYYDNTKFHRVVKGFIVQGGDPSGTGEGGESIYGHTFKDEFHSRLRFCRRGLVCMANAGKNDNGSQFFFTLGPAPELQNKHTIFGRVTGETLFNMLKLEEGEIGDDERPIYPHKIISAEILSNPFPDIVPRERVNISKPEQEPEKKTKMKAVKDFKLLSFGDEAEDDEQQIEIVNKNYQKKEKHLPELVVAENEDSRAGAESLISDSDEEEKTTEAIVEDIKNKLKSKKNNSSLTKIASLPQKRKVEDSQKTEKKEKLKKKTNSMLEEYKKEQIKYSEKMKGLPNRGNSRESHTLEMLKKFKAKLHSLKADSTLPTKEDDWMVHELKCDTKPVPLAKDANTKSDDWYDISDPRNSINKRRREGHNVRSKDK